MSTPALACARDVQARLNYIHPDCDPGVLYELQRESSTLVFDPRTVTIRDGRNAGLTLARHGLQIVNSPTRADLRDPEQVRTILRRETEALIKSLTGASEVWVFNEVPRLEDDPNAGKPAYTVHVDFDRKTLERFVRATHPDPDRVLARRFANLNLWRPIRTVERTPLALCEGSSIAAADQKVGIIRMKPDTPDFMPLSGFNIAYNPEHRWWWFPDMQPDEVLVFKLFDSDGGKPQLTAHTAFDDPGSSMDALPRRSLEVRTIAIF